jgi:hypothetical protein
MTAELPLQILPQPNDTTCGPTCLQTVYRFYGDEISLAQVVAEVPQLEGGGTLGSFLASHALKRGYNATIYTYNLTLFDPTWFAHESFYFKNKLQQQAAFKRDGKLGIATEAYSEFLDLGGKLKFQVLRPSLIRNYLHKGIPLLVGLSSTFLYHSMREFGPKLDYDDVRGEPTGHFVILHGYNSDDRTVRVADPLKGNPLGMTQIYDIDIDRVINAILLGIITYDANVIVITPKEGRDV